MLKTIKNIFHSFGLEISKRPTHQGKASFVIDGFHYGFSAPSANLTPWEGDAGFQNIYQQIKQYTLVDVYRCYELWQLAEKAYELDPEGAIIEIGVWKGGTAAIMGQKLKNINAKVPIYLADTFTGVAKATKEDNFYKGGEHSDTSEALVSDLMTTTVGYSGSIILKGIFPEDTQHLIPAGQRFSLCHIDVDVYASAKDTVDWIWDKMLPGGMIVFDDYGFHWCVGIAKYIEEQRHKKDRIIIHNLNGHAIIIKVK